MQKDNVVPNEKWAFDAQVTAAFDDMLSRSIPQYEVMRATVFNLGCHFVQPSSWIVDLGSSRGEALAPFVDKFGARNNFLAVEVSEPMIETLTQRFDGYVKNRVLQISKLDLRQQFPKVRSSLTLSILTLQFTPIEYRQRILQSVFDWLVPGGAFVLVEKILGNSADIDDMMIREYYNLKAEHGYTQDAIERKRLSLEGVLVPVTAKWNEELLFNAGFRHVDCFWRWMNFAGWVAVK